jgi:hypothetical protein
MKWSSILALSASVIFATACEKHPASQLEGHGGHGHAEEAKEGRAPAGEHGDAPKESGHGGAPKTGEAKPAEGKHDEAKPAEAPKFFPDSK